MEMMSFMTGFFLAVFCGWINEQLKSRRAVRAFVQASENQLKAAEHAERMQKAAAEFIKGMGDDK